MARHAVGRLAPEELDLFDETARAALEHGADRRRRHDDPLGFGADEASAVLVTTVAVGVAQDVLKSLAQQAGASLSGRLTAWFAGRRRSRAANADGDPEDGARPGGRAADTAPQPLTAEQLDGVRGVAQRRAVLLGLSEDRAGLLADAVVEFLGGPGDAPR
ncbi:hypothetical protein [Streptomyces sp. cg36]|uniref:hypothetical protein n=1 Tax=Streptomyces sp. cg36 TaxID=3238798 RepID=UPI0034E299A9